MKKTFDELIAKLKDVPMKKVAVACAQDSAVLEAVKAAKDRGIADAILVGDEAKIKDVAASIKMDIGDFEIIHYADDYEAALAAVKLVHDGNADMYMKGLIDTRAFLKSVLDREVGLRTGAALSHVCVFDVDGVDQLLFLTDVAFIPYPTLEDKINIIKNTLVITEACGLTNPKVAPLAAVEVVNPKMPCTVEAAELKRMSKDGEISGCVIDGPLSLDLAIDPEAAIHKGATDRDIQGDADILLFPDLHSGNLVYKALVHTAKVKNGNILTGTKAPVILTSRSDECECKINSIALGAVVADAMKKAAAVK
ncbi:MAG: phosphate butyryltransferase [Lachnospiraceae bacterium]|nr:phosphate butyryltransferase [Lachnospiraceae bacterium]